MHSPKKYLRAAMRVITTNVRLGAGKLLHGSRLRFSPVTCLALSDGVELSSKAKIDFGRSLRTRGRCSFNVQESGELVFGEGIFLNQGCQFNCHSRIEVGDGCEFGPNVLVYDHDHVFRGGCSLMGSSPTATCALARDAGLGLAPSYCAAHPSATAASSRPAAWSRATCPTAASSCRSGIRAFSSQGRDA